MYFKIFKSKNGVKRSAKARRRFIQSFPKYIANEPAAQAAGSLIIFSSIGIYQAVALALTAP